MHCTYEFIRNNSPISGNRTAPILVISYTVTMGKTSKRNRNKKSPPKSGATLGGAAATAKSPLVDSKTNKQEDPRADLLRELSQGLLNEKGMANIENLIALMDTPGIGDPGMTYVVWENVHMRNQVISSFPAYCCRWNSFVKRKRYGMGTKRAYRW